MIHAYVGPTTRNNKQLYAVLISGDVEPIITGSDDPEYDTCRKLVARGQLGPIRFYMVTREGGVRPSISFDDLRNAAALSREEAAVIGLEVRQGLTFKDIEKAAGRRVKETAKEGPKVVKWEPDARWSKE
jgi:hypothetical protein